MGKGGGCSCDSGRGLDAGEESPQEDQVQYTLPARKKGRMDIAQRRSQKP